MKPIMKTSLLLVALLAGLGAPSPLVAQNTFGGRIPAKQGAPPVAEGLKHFNLDFPGGTPRELVAAISKATSQHLNVIVPARQAGTKIMPIKVENVTVPELFRAIATSSKREVPVVTGPGTGGQKTIQMHTSSLSFQQNSEPVTDETIWSFQSTEPDEEYKAMISAVLEPEQVCQYFQLGPYLQDNTIEDITTAIQTGWKMLKVDPMPQLSFHQETKLLIAVGAAERVVQIPNVLAQLPLDNTVAVERIAKWQAELEDIEAKKAGDWEKQALEKRWQIARLAHSQKARETIQNPPPYPQGPPPMRTIQSK